MIGKLTTSIMLIMMLSFLIIIMSFFFQHINLQNKIDDIVYNTVEIISTSGVFTKDLYNSFYENINKFSKGASDGDKYIITIKLEKQIKQGIYDVFYENSIKFNEGIRDISNNDILDLPLDIGDKITIYVKDASTTIFGSLINTSFMGYTPKTIDTNIESVKTGVIANRKRNVVKGYDVIAKINTEEYFDVEQIHVWTKVRNESIYSSGIKYIEPPASDGDYIFPQGEFLEEIESISDVVYDDDGVEYKKKVIRYIQQ